MYGGDRIAYGAGVGWGAGAVLWLLVAILATPLPVAAQSSCELALQNASDLFDQGRFAAAEGFIQECLQSNPRRAEKVQAYALRAKMHLADDDILAAEHSLKLLLSVDPDYEPDLFDSPRYQKLVAEMKATAVSPTVTSVSKAKESLLEAPATVAVITADEIERRGYLDLEAVLHDLPGFDFSRRAGAVYSNVYQRGYRSIETNRTLILIDGVEDNDLASSTAWISRQYPLSMIDRIEVVYGPASTMYGANALAGVINVITKEPEQVIADGKGFGFDAWATGGSWGTGAIDAVMAGRSATGSISWSLGIRKYESDDFDHLKNYEAWDYDPSYYDSVDYQGRSNLNITDPAAAAALLAANPNGVGPYFDVSYDAEGNPLAVTLNAAGAARARELDLGLVSNIDLEVPVDDWMVYGKLKTSNMVFGLQYWRRMEGSNIPLRDTSAATGAQGFTWTPKHLSLYMKYFKRYYEDKLHFTLFTRYKQHELDGNDSGEIFLRTYDGSFPATRLGVQNLIDETPAGLATSYSYRSNNQLRTEANLFYDHSERFNIVGGVELRFSSIGAKNIEDSSTPAQEEGEPANAIAGGNQISSRDVGAYAQASYRPWQPFKLVAGMRWDNNSIRDIDGYGSVFNSRLAAVYSWRDFVFKAVYSEAFQDAPNFQKYETTDSRLLDNPDLQPEEVSNIELAAAWSPNEDLSFQIAGYEATYKGIVAEVTVNCPPDLDCGEAGTTRQFQNVGTLDLKGIQAEGRWSPGAFRLTGNYTWADPFSPDDDKRVGDIATHRVNLIGELSFWNERMDAALRVNGVFGRDTGADTTASLNPSDEVDNYTVAHAAITYRNLLPGLDLQLAINNIFDTEYFDPAFRNYPSWLIEHDIPQPPRTYFVSLRYSR